jgi:hypothetical protein
MNTILTNWRTTAAGAAAILGGLADVATQIATVHPDPTRLWADGIAIVTGLGLIGAKDAGAK